MKIWIIGNQASGKTLLAEKIESEYQIPALHLDRLKPWNDRFGYLDSLDHWLKGESWIIEGVYGQGWGAEEISKGCDSIIWLDPDREHLLDNKINRRLRRNHARYFLRKFYNLRFREFDAVSIDKYWGKGLTEPYRYNWAFHKEVWENHKGPKKKCKDQWSWSDIKNFLNNECKSK